MIIFHEKYFIDSIPFENFNPKQKKQHNTKFRNIHNIEKKLTLFQTYHKIQFACKYKNPLYKTQYSEKLVEYDDGFDMTTGKIKYNPYATHKTINKGTPYIPVNLHKNAGNSRGKVKQQYTESTRLQKLSPMNSS